MVAIEFEAHDFPLGGQYSEDYAKLVKKAADDFPSIRVTQIAKAGEEFCVMGGYPMTVAEGNVALNISGFSEYETRSLQGFWARVKELEAAQEADK